MTRGYVQVYTGNGKGKTTAALGLALRAAGAGHRVFIGQFIKEGRYSEIEALERLSEWIDCRQYGRGCWLRGNPRTEDIDLAQNALAKIRERLSKGGYQVVILDEIVTAQFFGLVDVWDLLQLIEARPPEVELVMTGRYAPLELIEAADLVTEMREVKHYYHQGVLARKGIES